MISEGSLKCIASLLRLLHLIPTVKESEGSANEDSGEDFGKEDEDMAVNESDDGDEDDDDEK